MALRISPGHSLPSSTSYDTSYRYSPARVYQEERYYSEADTRIVSYDKSYYETHHRSETILHPDTMEPMDANKLQSISKADRDSKVNSRSKGSVELRIDGSWSLGITMSSDGLVQKIHEGTPASRAKLIFESRVRSIVETHISIDRLSADSLFLKYGIWLAGQSKINPGDNLVGICGNQLTDKGQAAYSLCHCTVGKSEVRFAFEHC
jgi:hypothetical protein